MPASFTLGRLTGHRYRKVIMILLVKGINERITSQCDQCQSVSERLLLIKVIHHLLLTVRGKKLMTGTLSKLIRDFAAKKTVILQKHTSSQSCLLNDLDGVGGIIINMTLNPMQL